MTELNVKTLLTSVVERASLEQVQKLMVTAVALGAVDKHALPGFENSIKRPQLECAGLIRPLWCQILEYTSPRDKLLNVSLVCSNMNSMVKDPYSWTLVEVPLSNQH